MFIRIAERRDQCRLPECLQARERAERMQLGQRVVARNHLFQQRNRRLVLPLEEQTLCGVAMPAIRVAQRRHQIGGGGLVQSHPLADARRAGGRHDAIDAAAVVAVVEVEVLLDFIRDAPRYRSPRDTCR